MNRRDNTSDSGRRAHKKKARRDDAQQGSSNCQHSGPSLDVGQAEALHSPAETTAAYPEIGLGLQQPSAAGRTSFVDHGYAHGPSAFATATASNLGIDSSQRLRLHQELDAAIRGHAWDTTAQTPWEFSDQTPSALAGMGLSSAQLPQAGAMAMQPGMASLQRPMFPSQYVLSGITPTIFGSYPTNIGVASLDRSYLDALAMATALQSHTFSQPAPSMTMNQFISTTTRPLAFVLPQPLLAPLTQSSAGVPESLATALTRATSQPPAASAISNHLSASQAEPAAWSSTSSSTSLPPQGPPQPKCVFPMWCDDDQVSASKYQCVLRRQIEYFVADHEDLQVKAQGRNIPIRLGQVGIRCRHCAAVDADAEGIVRTGPSTTDGDGAAADTTTDAADGVQAKRNRAIKTGKGTHRRGAVYYPSKVSTIFQAVQNMATNHFVSGACTNIPPSILEEIVTLKSLKPNPSRRGEGKGYWARSAASLGIANAGGDETNGGSGLVLLRRQPTGYPQSS